MAIDSEPIWARGIIVNKLTKMVHMAKKGNLAKICHLTNIKNGWIKGPLGEW